MEMERVFSELSENRGYFPLEAVEEAIGRCAEITPYLMRSLQEAHRAVGISSFFLIFWPWGTTAITGRYLQM